MGLGNRQPILVAACGNPDAGDDSFGHRVAECLRACRLAGVTVIDLGLRSSSLLDHLPGPSALFVIDAVRWPGAAPGVRVDADWFDPKRPPVDGHTLLSSHGLSLAHQLELGERLALLPAVVRLVGMTIGDGDAETGRSITEAVRSGVPWAVEVIRRYATRSRMPQRLSGM